MLTTTMMMLALLADGDDTGGSGDDDGFRHSATRKPLLSVPGAGAWWKGIQDVASIVACSRSLLQFPRQFVFTKVLPSSSTTTRPSSRLLQLAANT